MPPLAPNDAARLPAASCSASVESLGGVLLGESLGQVGIFVIFIAVLMLRPQGFFGAKA
jgi:branched-subunit amino acid ABC-type transport system permease component